MNGKINKNAPIDYLYKELGQLLVKCQLTNTDIFTTHQFTTLINLIYSKLDERNKHEREN